MITDASIFNDIRILRKNRAIRKRKDYRTRINPLTQYSDEEFLNFYRFDKASAMAITDLVRDKLQRKNRRGKPLSPEDMVLSFLRYIGKGQYQRDIARLHNFSQQSMTNVIKKVAEALASKMSTYIKFPTTAEKISKIKRGFYNKFGFPQCIGAIDGSHFKIKNPGGELGGRQRCRKGFYSLNVQVICDSEYKIMDIVTRWRGSAHDSRIFRLSNIKRKLETMDDVIKGGVLLGDGGYANSKILLTPFRANHLLNNRQKNYQQKHIRARNVIEQLFGQIKNKFRICLNGIQLKLRTAKNVIVAIAVLHNISKERNHPNTLLFSNTSHPHESNASTDLYQRNSRYRDRFIEKYF